MTEPKPIFIGICNECKKDKPIVIVCMIGCFLCGECQADQNRISAEELTSHVLSERRIL